MATYNGGIESDTINGSEDNDTITGGFGADRLFGLGGADVVYGNQDNDIVYGNQGDDSLYGGQGDDAVFGGQGNDVVFGNFGADILYGNNGDDVIYGNQDNDTIYDGAGNDTVYGGQGDDRLVVGSGNNLVVGGVGFDVAVFEGSRNEFTMGINEEGNFVFTRTATGERNVFSGVEAFEFNTTNTVTVPGETVYIPGETIYVPTPVVGPDIITSNPNANLEDQAHNANNEIFVGAGNFANNYGIVRNESEQVEVGQKFHVRQANDTFQDYIQTQNADGSRDVNVEAGPQRKALGSQNDVDNRANWSVDYSILTGFAGNGNTLDDYDVVARYDLDPTAAVRFLTSDQLNEVRPDLAQDSFNYGFIRGLISGGDVAAGDYQFGAAQFDIQYDVFEKGTTNLVASNLTHVNVTDDASLIRQG